MSETVKRYNMDLGRFGNVDSYESEHGRWVKHGDYARLEQECERLSSLWETELSRATTAESECTAKQWQLDAALAECERLRNEQGAETFLTLTGEIVKANTELQRMKDILREIAVGISKREMPTEQQLNEWFDRIESALSAKP